MSYHPMRLNRIDKKIIAAKQASENILNLSDNTRKKVLLDISFALLRQARGIIAANKKDIAAAKKIGRNESFIERLALNQEKIASLADSIRKIALKKDILFKKIEARTMPSGITIQKVRVPLGLIAIIFESRPNVTADAFALAFKSGNAVILKGGKEIKYTNNKLIDLIKKILSTNKISPEIIQDVGGINRNLTKNLISNELIDCLIPRGGKKLIDFVKNNAKISVIITGASVVHAYVDEDADLSMAKKIILNAKTRRVSICNALDVILLHKKIYKKLLNLSIMELSDKKVEIRADEISHALLKKIRYSKLKLAKPQDFNTEFLDYILAIKVVRNFSEALAHIKKHSLGHSEIIITKSKYKAKIFFKQIDAACLYLNTSSQFSDGGEFGLGGEIGISTQKLHARGPFAFQELMTYKYIISSKGALRK
ncbi:glutamate-5-semialdehyde dehydrogenase [Candidatus Falkowbacteria bacterium CG02_land_8_20_14_3_00_36_14]|uniref:Gamma-glutamyl phosphate reductase n=1 Tax=Candidatus Falkowbacteria bacterium CG02_land_8_20_14_3_00_36_14 TaxID=1974560 RepID=A0A2M7DQL6_9BACT|nr:MAG: glutamate-5-semialdehyde dehydrogenase [Candidatus Falkowbacteria bacterium CG02_land_8_20_14_3_00_36_14]